MKTNLNHKIIPVVFSSASSSTGRQKRGYKQYAEGQGNLALKQDVNIASNKERVSFESLLLKEFKGIKVSERGQLRVTPINGKSGRDNSQRYLEPMQQRAIDTLVGYWSSN